MKGQYLITTDGIKIAYNYNSKHDLLVEIKKKGGNMLMDFYRFSLYEKGKNVWDLKEEELKILQTTVTDWHGPFIVGAVDNIDGDDTESFKFTGGNHEYTNTGIGGEPNARTLYIKFFIDGKEVKQGYGYFDNIEIYWKNNIQAYNTQKEDGSGREVLCENHTLKFNGYEFISYFELQPLEDVFVKAWYGLQGCMFGDLYKTIQYVDGIDDKPHLIDDIIPCGNNSATKLIASGEEHRFEMEIDKNVDLGDRRMYKGEKGIFHATYKNKLRKAYFFVIENQHLKANNIYKLKGTYRFLSNK